MAEETTNIPDDDAPAEPSAEEVVEATADEAGTTADAGPADADAGGSADPVTTDEATAAAAAAPSGEAAEASDEAEAEAAGPSLSKKEQRAAARHAEASQRPSRTPEERNAERIAERARKAAARRRRRQKEKARAGTREKGPAKTASPVEHGPGRPKVRLGTVVSDKADKTITVRIDTARRHRRYEKIVRSSSTLHAHDEANEANAGDLVRVIESRPLSRTKRWRLVEILERAR